MYKISKYLVEGLQKYSTFCKTRLFKGSLLQTLEGERSIILAKIVINKENTSKTIVGKL